MMTHIRSSVSACFLSFWALSLPAAAQHPQQQQEPLHGGRMAPMVNPDGSPTRWVEILIGGINESTNVEAWEQKEAMRCRIDIEFLPVREGGSRDGDDEGDSEIDGHGDVPARDGVNGDGAKGDEAEASRDVVAKSIRGVITYDVPNRVLRFDDDEGLSFLVERDGHVNIWHRERDEPVTRDDVPDETLSKVRALAFVLVMPLRLNDHDDVRFGPGMHSRLLGDQFFRGHLSVRQQDEAQEDEESRSEGAARRRIDLPPDWYMYFAYVFEPHYLRAIGYLNYDRSKRLTEIPMPRAVKFDEYETVDEIALPVKWTMWNFGRHEGIRGDEPIGTVEVSEIAFVEREDGMFDVPSWALRVR